MANESTLQFKGTQLKIIQVLLQTADTVALDAALAELTGHSPDFFENELAVLDFSTAENLPAAVDWEKIGQMLKQSGLHAVACLGLPESLADAALAAGLPLVDKNALSRPQRLKAEAEPQPEPVPASPPPTESAAPAPASIAPPPRTITLDKPLRSGQRFFAQGCDLIVTAMISAGAEVIADGNIHIYAPLRGRALAGASGDASARIFTTCMEAELVSVAGLYRTFEAGVPPELLRQPTTISLIDEAGKARLHVAPLALK